MVAEAETWNWSSAAVHCGAGTAGGWLAMGEWNERWNVSSWKAFLADGATEPEMAAIRQSTHTGRPLGTEEFVNGLEEATKRALAPRKGGRPAKLTTEERQGELFD